MAQVAPGDAALLQVRGLTVSYRLRRGRTLQAVRGIDVTVKAGEVVALVGESGSGKSSAVRGIMQLHRPSGGQVWFAGRDLCRLRGKELRRARRGMQMVFQDPFSSLDPAMTVGEIIGEPLVAHTDHHRAERRRLATEMLELVGLQAAHVDRYPHEFSGGQRQRIAIARALVLRPELLIADEAVSALDVSTQNQVLTLLRRLISELGVACLFITHDLAVVRNIADRVVVLYLGTVVEEGPVDTILTRPAHPYTRALLSAAPIADPVVQRSRTRIRLVGELPDPTNPPAGCVFSTRCPDVIDLCRSTPPASTSSSPHTRAACHLLTPSVHDGGEAAG